MKRRKVKWEDDSNGWIVRMDSESLRLEWTGGYWYIVRFGIGDNVMIKAGTPENAKYQAVQLMRKKIKQLAIEWGVLK